MALVSLIAAGCDGPTRADGGTTPDAGADGGPGVDAGPGVDGGSGSDAGTDGGASAVCGDRAITAPEECDDGNTTPGDGCDASCVIETSSTCGNGIVERGSSEECDDGNTTGGDGCSARCLVEAPSGCGDGALDLASGEECDDGNTLPGDGCSPSCQLEAVGAFCGDGTIDAREVCDDGNTTGGDGCNPTCNLTGTVSTFVGDGMRGRLDGVGTMARIYGAGALAADDRYLWFAESGDGMAVPPVMAALRRIEIATAQVRTIATLGGPGAEGVATNGTDTVWVASGSGTGPAIFAVEIAPPHTVTPVAGSARCTSAACYADGPLGSATFGEIRGLTWFRGLLWIVDPPAGTIRTLDPATNVVTTVAGSAFMNVITDGVGTAARFESPRYIVSDNSGMLYISETNGNCIRALNASTYDVTTFVGEPNMLGYVDDVGRAARLHRPRGITADASSVYFVEFNFHAVRQAVFATQAVSTLAGMPGPTGGYVEGVGGAAQFDGPWSVAYHFPSNSLFVSDGGNDVIRRIQ